MSAHHHIHLTTKITLSVAQERVENNDFLSCLPKRYQDDFEYVYSKNFTQESPELSDGSRLKWKKVLLVFSLKKEYLSKVKNLISDSLKTSEDFLYHNDDRYKELLIKFRAKFEKDVEIDVDTLYSVNEDNSYKDSGYRLSGELKNIDENYFTGYTEVPSYVVYSGLPDCFDGQRYSFVGFTIVYSHCKLGECPNETAILFDKLKADLSKQNKYNPLNKFIYHLEY